MAKKTAPYKVEERLAQCLGRAVLSNSVVFEGCPSVTQLAARVVYYLGYEPEVVQGRARTFDGKVVDHVWVEIPELDLGIETNPSQIRGLPHEQVPVMVVDLSYFNRNTNTFDRQSLLDQITPAGEKFFSRLAKQVAKCVGQ